MRSVCKVISGVLLLVSVTLAQTVTKLYIPGGAGGDGEPGAVVVYGMETGRAITSIQLARDAALAVPTADSSEIWVFGGASTTCDVISSATDKVLKTFDIGGVAASAAFSPDNKYCFAVVAALSAPGKSLLVIDRQNYSVAYPIGEITDPTDVVVSNDSRYLYCASASQGTISKIEIPSFKVVRSTHVGIEPVDIELSPDGRFLLVACQGLSSGRRGGSQIAIVDTEDDKLFWVLDNIGKAPSSIAFVPDMSRMVVTYAIPSESPSENVRIFKIEMTADSITLSHSAGYLLGQSPQGGLVVADGRYWVGSDPSVGGVLAIDLSGDTVVLLEGVFRRPRPLKIAAVTFDVGRRLTELQDRMAAARDSALIPDLYLDMAYLYKTADRKNEMVAAYQKVIDNFPRSFASISSGLTLAEICHGNQLFAQSAEYDYNALDSYSSYLSEPEAGKRLPQSSLLAAADRLALFSTQFNKDYLKRIAESYLGLTAKGPELAEMFFRLGYNLRKADESKIANRCFAEARNQLISIEDPALSNPLSARLALATGDARAFYKIKERKKAPDIDGDLTEWQKDKPLTFSGTSGFAYGTAPWHGAQDLSGSIYFARTASDLYIAGTVSDDTLVAIDDAHADMVAIAFDLRPGSGSYFTREFTPGDGCFSLQVVAPSAGIPKARFRSDLRGAYEIASAQTADGYSFELRLSLSAFGGWLVKETKRFGLGVELVDFDNPSDSKQAKAIGFLIPFDGVGGASRPELFGVAEL